MRPERCKGNYAVSVMVITPVGFGEGLIEKCIIGIITMLL
jgi:hypothetical protein